jgi:hypothetical protein
MLTRAARTIGGGFRGFGAQAARIRRAAPLAALTFALALSWLIGTGWWNYVRPHEFDAKAYEHYREEVANCRELDTSEARYDCVAQAMIRRDRVNFGTAMLVFLPPILLVFGHYVWREARATVRERERARRAEQHSRQHLSKFRSEMIGERAAAIARARLADEARQRRTYDAQTPHAPPIAESVDPAQPAPKRA